MWKSNHFSRGDHVKSSHLAVAFVAANAKENAYASAERAGSLSQTLQKAMEIVVVVCMHPHAR